MTRSIKVAILGDSRSLTHALGGAEKGLGSFGKAAAVTAAAAAATGAAFTAVAVKSANTFKRVGGEVLKLQRYTGATAEDASRLRFAFKQAGIDTEIASKSLGLLSKNLAGTKLDKLGLDLKDASGKARPLNDSLLNIAERFQKMPNGAEKTALAMQLFGRSGAQMIPFLNRGAKGIAELEKMSDKFGNTLSGKDLDAVKEATKNQRLFSSAMEGLQIQIGRYVLPIMTKFTGMLARNMPSAIAAVRSGMQKLQPVFDAVGAFIDKAAAAVGAFVYTLRTGFTQDEGTPIERLALLFRETLLPILEKITKFVSANLKPILIVLGAAFIALTSPVTAVVAALVIAYTKFETVRTVIGAVAAFFTGTVIPAVTALAEAINTQFQNLSEWVRAHWAAIQESIGHVLVAVQAVIGVFVAAVGAVWRMWGDNLMTIVSTVWGQMQTVVQTAVAIIAGIIETAVNLINGDWGAAWDSFKGIFSAAWNGVVDLLKGYVKVVVSIVSGIGEVIGRAGSGIFDGLKSAFKAAINWIIEKWNGIEFKVPGFDPPGPGPKFGGFTIGTPNIHKLATGGIVTRPTLALIGEAGPEAVVPLSRGGMGGNIIIYGNVDRNLLGELAHKQRLQALQMAAS